MNNTKDTNTEKQTIKSFAVRNTGDTPFRNINREQREGYEQGGLLGTLRLNSMNREQREQYEQGETDHTNFRDFRAFRG